MESDKQPAAIGTPAAEISIDEALVCNLLKQQHPDLSHLPVKLFDAGWDNVMFRLGDEFLIRLPRRQAAAQLIEREQTWLPQIAPQLTIPVPIPERVGYPTSSYPWRWSILPWLDGVTADCQQLKQNQGKYFSDFLRSLHQPAPANAPHNSVRGTSLKQRASSIEPRLRRLELKTSLITTAVKRAWYQALETAIDVEATWLHGDRPPGNILVKNGEIVGIVDWGDITSGDRATDLAAIWMLFEHQDERMAIAKYADISLATLQRAQGWAIYFGIILLDVGLIDNPRQAIIGQKTLDRVAQDNPQ